MGNKGIFVGTLDSTPSSVDINISRLSATRFTARFDGITFSGSTVYIQGGDGTVFENVKVTSPASGVIHTSLDITGAASSMGSYTFDAVCSHLRFNLTGGANPDVDITLFPEPRS